MSKHYHRRIRDRKLFEDEWERIFGQYKEKKETSPKATGEEDATPVKKKAVAGDEQGPGGQVAQ